MDATILLYDKNGYWTKGGTLAEFRVKGQLRDDLNYFLLGHAIRAGQIKVRSQLFRPI